MTKIAEQSTAPEGVEVETTDFPFTFTSDITVRVKRVHPVVVSQDHEKGKGDRASAHRFAVDETILPALLKQFDDQVAEIRSGIRGRLLSSAGDA